MRKECQSFATCSAPFCPLDPESLKHGIWYPDEEICKTHFLDWIKAQKKIAKRTPDKEKYFTFEMLNRNCVIARGIVGLDPDKDEKPQLKRWLGKHPPKRELTEEEKAVLRERMRKAREKSTSKK